MAITILAIIYTSFICWSYGSLLQSILAKLTGDTTAIKQSAIITCLTGLAFIGVIYTALSLFTPVGSFALQLLLLIPALLGLYIKRADLTSTINTAGKRLTELNIPVIALLLSFLLLLLLMHTSIVNHPDTLNYHAQQIEWAKNYKAIPGLIHLNINLGTQSSWFVLSALFSFSFTGTNALTFINASVLCWFIIFIAQKIHQSYRENKIINGILWLLLLAFSTWSYPQLRLTASSGSPDFIAALYVWMILYLFATQAHTRSRSLCALLVFLSFFAITIKLSTLPCILLSLYAWYWHGKPGWAKGLLFPITTGILIFIPYLARNVISTGYLVFPSAFPDLFHVDWKLQKDHLVIFQQYIKAYARTHVSYDTVQINAVINSNISTWLPAWWKLWSVADKTLLASVPVLLGAAIPWFKDILEKKNRAYAIVLLVCLAGLIFWFAQAPDPRFGYGFIIPFSGTILYIIVNAENKMPGHKVLTFFVLLFSVAVFMYNAFRLKYHFTMRNFISPTGILTQPHRSIDCNGILINMPDFSIECGNIPAPCTNNECGDFIPRGKKVEDGFRRGK